ncbi:alpha/beta hydrolase [Pseudonocardia sp. RS11V-5]|uniref:alpha/beta fold hydrolase n=1 Tax=Pseudonocardia terrae TaxID=2905831 RepID=UPI001E440D0D|nr:alpha/beta hydrolase [Pseudonocardia terrae]MCE3554762.1 alpha/beta hydrolase [Pseudonocardia terrae]
MNRVEIDGAAYEYEDVPGTGAPLLFLHEGLGSVGLWRGFHRRIAEATGRRAVAYSRLGHGFSDLPSAKHTIRFAHEEATTVVPALVEALDLGEPVLVGHSDGGSIALLAAAALPVSGLVVLAPHVLVEEIGLRAIEEAKRAFDSGDLARRMARHHRDAEVCFRNWNDVWLDPAFRDWDLRPELAGITCPVLGIQGDADPYGTAVHVEAVRDAAQADIDLLLLHSGHAPHLERPGLVDATVAGWLAGL